MALPGEPCEIEPQSSWTEPERWVWKKVCEGRIANFNDGEKYGGKCDPTLLKAWQQDRMLRNGFLETILLHEPFRSCLPRQGVQIVGAWFKELLDLSHAILAHQLSLEGCRFEMGADLSFFRTSKVFLLKGSVFEAEVNLIGARVGGYFDLSGSTFKANLNMNALLVNLSLLMRKVTAHGEVDLHGGNIMGQISMIGAHFKRKLNMNGLRVSELLSMRDGAEFAAVDLTSANIGAGLDMVNSNFTDSLILDGATVGGSLFMKEGSRFEKEVSLIKAKIEDDLNMIGSHFKGDLNMNGARIGGSLLMREKASFAKVSLGSAQILGSVDMRGSCFKRALEMRGVNVGGMLTMGYEASFRDANLSGAKIEGALELSGSSINGRLNMFGLRVGQTMLAGNTQFVGGAEVQLIYADISGNLDIAGSTLPSFNLTGTKVRGEFRLSSEEHPTIKWEQNATLTLQNTEVGALQDRIGAWPSKLELDGFKYISFSRLSRRKVCSLIEWLKKQPLYSPQPYEQLASVLRKAGQQDKANEILYAASERVRDGARWSRWLWLTMLKIFIGYGYRVLTRISFWAFTFTVLGIIVLRASAEGPAHGMPYGIFYSLDTLLPIIEIRKYHSGVDLSGWARYYFYFHKLMGWLLASFLVAGLSGLTKK